MREPEFLSRLHRSYSKWLTTNGKRGWWHKIIDAGYRNPFDVVACLPGGRMMCIEGKVSRLKNLVNFKSLFSHREHELQSLLHNQVAGALCWVIFAHKGNGREWKAFAIKPEIVQGLLLNGSTNVEELIAQDMIIELGSLGEGNWDLANILK